jgi:hypothetical protein
MITIKIAKICFLLYDIDNYFAVSAGCLKICLQSNCLAESSPVMEKMLVEGHGSRKKFQREKNI